MAEKNAIFEDAAPDLSKNKFAKEAMDHEDQLRCLDQASAWTRREKPPFSVYTAALWPPAVGAAIQRQLQRKGTLPSSQELQEKRIITRRGPEEPSKETEATKESGTNNSI